MLQTARQFAAICADTLELPDPIYEFGSFLVPDQPVDGDLRPLFPGRDYVGTDMREGPGVDRVLDLHGLDLPEGSVGTAISFDTLEHVRHPWRATAELRRVLRPDGVLMLSVPFNFPVHGYPDDYWRFTPQAVEVLLEPFAHHVIRPFGPEGDPYTVLAVAFASTPAAEPLARFEAAFEECLRRWAALSDALERQG